VELDAGGELEVAVYPWDIAVRPGAGPAGALTGTVAATTIEGGRLRVRVDDWIGEAESVEGLEPGRVAHGVVRRLHPLAG
jgi:hypothetical protein